MQLSYNTLQMLQQCMDRLKYDYGVQVWPRIWDRVLWINSSLNASDLLSKFIGSKEIPYKSSESDRILSFT
jgi:hypothetical protein